MEMSRSAARAAPCALTCASSAPALYAHENGFTVITSSLGISRWKNMNRSTTGASARRAINWTSTTGPSNLAQAGGGARMIEISKREEILPAGILRLRLFPARHQCASRRARPRGNPHRRTVLRGRSAVGVSTHRSPHHAASRHPNSWPTSPRLDPGPAAFRTPPQEEARSRVKPGMTERCGATFSQP